MTETLLSAADRKRIAEIVRVEVRLAIRDLHIAEGCLRLGDAGRELPRGVKPRSLDDNWVYEEP